MRLRIPLSNRFLREATGGNLPIYGNVTKLKTMFQLSKMTYSLTTFSLDLMIGE